MVPGEKLGGVGDVGLREDGENCEMSHTRSAGTLSRFRLLDDAVVIASSAHRARIS